MHAALDSFAAMDKDNQVVILGDMLELGNYSAKEHQAIVDRVAELRFSLVMLIVMHFLAQIILPQSMCLIQSKKLSNSKRIPTKRHNSFAQSDHEELPLNNSSINFNLPIQKLKWV